MRNHAVVTFSIRYMAGPDLFDVVGASNRKRMCGSSRAVACEAQLDRRFAAGTRSALRRRSAMARKGTPRSAISRCEGSARAQRITKMPIAAAVTSRPPKSFRADSAVPAWRALWSRASINARAFPSHRLGHASALSRSTAHSRQRPRKQARQVPMATSPR